VYARWPASAIRWAAAPPREPGLVQLLPIPARSQNHLPAGVSAFEGATSELLIASQCVHLKRTRLSAFANDPLPMA